jgi:3-methyladenine DNA glycosylase AlkD
MEAHHKEILALIKARSGKGTQHTDLDSYLGNSHPRYPIAVPVLRTIARAWMLEHKSMSHVELSNVLSSLAAGKSGTEKSMVGTLLDYATAEQKGFSPKLLDEWLGHLIGWAEVDSLCTGKYSATEVPRNWKAWQPLLRKFSKSDNIQKRRASIVLLCSPLSKASSPALAETGFENIDRLKHEKEVLITKAISWLLRSMIKHHRTQVEDYVNENLDSLPKIAIRETLQKLKTGKKTTRKSKAD